jgi:hypothetical protein
MDETRVEWWMDHTSRWHRGLPPAGWWQAEDGRWHPPDDGDEPTAETREGSTSTGPAHLASGPHSRVADDSGGRGRPGWARDAVLVSVALLAILVAAGAAIIGGGGDDRGTTRTGDTTTTSAPATARPSVPGTEPHATSPGSARPSPTEEADPPSSATTERVPTTTTLTPDVPPATEPTAPPPADTGVRQGATCSPEGATAVTSDGVPMTCTTQKCHGAPFDSARWRRSAC